MNTIISQLNKTMPYDDRTIPSAILCLSLLMCLAPTSWAASVQVSSVTQLTRAVNDGAVGDTIIISAGTYLLPAPLVPKANMTIKGAGIASTILKPSASWKPGSAAVIEPINWDGVNTSAYCFYLGTNNGTHNVTISDMTMDGMKQLQGAVCGNSINHLTIHNVFFHDFTFCGVRVIGGSKLVIHDCEFINMAISGMDPEAGAVVFAWLSDSEFFNNQFYNATHGLYYGGGVNAGNFHGIKGRQLSNSRIHHNTMLVNFSIELPFDDNSDVEVDHNYLEGWISMPKYAGGSIPASGVSMRIHHNYDSSAVVAEYPRNCVEIDHNLLDNPRSEGGSMLSGWASEPTLGSTKMHDNLIKNLGRVLADVGQYNNLQFYNNNVNAPLNAGVEKVLFIVDGNMDKSSFVFKDNIVDCSGHPRALLWSGLGAGFTSIKNNTLINVTDQGNYANPDTGATRGPLEPLYFTCGAPGNQFLVDQWAVTPIGPLIECEDNVQSSSYEAKVVNESAASGGKYSFMTNSASTGSVVIQWPDFPHGNKKLKILVEKGPASATVQVSTAVNSPTSAYRDVGLPIDLYSDGPKFAMIDLGLVSLPPGTRYFKFTITGKNSSSSSYDVALDALSFD